MPVQLPAPNNIVNLPNAPQDPPTARDVRAAQQYVKNVDIAFGSGRITDVSHVAASLAYQHSLMGAYRGVDAAPAWFADAVKEALKDSLKELKDDLRDIKLDIRDIKDGIEDIKKNVDTLKDDVCLLKEHSVKTQILAAKSHNLRCGNGSGRPFEPVPFLDGKEPSAQDLPLLTDLAVIRKLSPRDSSAYYKGYHRHQGALPAPAVRIEAIRVFVGCSLD
ncbi:hypothetical protein DFH08DRAFT_1085900 [Mycena albidolilacea]|uniref:Mug135-like C-terminal domain-containing protein n=1 Tax=Mycena albidolilacea TaxID=1033008 RepID=A0AAD7EFN1_9AGAR|nr:hypothetical protein DFH08DRAFT_1085900 [Mycena albidolilacea]